MNGNISWREREERRREGRREKKKWKEGRKGSQNKRIKKKCYIVKNILP